MIRDATLDDAAGIAAVYNHYIEHTIVSFETEPVTAGAMAGRIDETLRAFPYLVLEEDERITGYAYAGRWQTRCAYRRTLESTIYLSHDIVGRGHGTALYTALFDEMAKLEPHVIIAGISLPNAASVAIHEKFGFEKVAHYKEVGRKFGKWIDVGYWQKMVD